MPRTVIATGRIDLRATLAPLAALARDPTVRLNAGRFERATLTPDGPAVVVITWSKGEETAEAETFGDGATWLLERTPGLLGCEDDVAGFAPETQPLRELWRLHSGDRVGRTATLWQTSRGSSCSSASTAPTPQFSGVAWSLIWAGRPPGVADLLLPPAAQDVGRLGYSDLHRYGIDGKRAENLIRAARVARQLQTFVDRDSRAASAALRSVPGSGSWTSSCLLAQT